jgi:hypothetical protein
MTEEEVRKIVSETVAETLQGVGLAGDVKEMQADMAHLRRWRKSVEKTATISFLTAATIILTGLLGAMWLGLRQMFGAG